MAGFRATRYVPRHRPPSPEDSERFWQCLRRYLGRLLVLTGAGVSTESGIPDYRSDGVGRFATSKERPIQHDTFLHCDAARKRYWARNFVAWPYFSSVLPNESHRVLAAWERCDWLPWLITQNVDQLHGRAGSRRLTELHGSTARVVCLRCGRVHSRADIQQMMAAMNPSLGRDECLRMAPDGDADLSVAAVDLFRPPRCPDCASDLLKPDVVFFGANVAREVVADCYDRLDGADALLVLGSSLHVFSGYRFALKAAATNTPIFVVNIGPTRADHLAAQKLSCACSAFLRNCD